MRKPNHMNAVVWSNIIAEYNALVQTYHHHVQQAAVGSDEWRHHHDIHAAFYEYAIEEMEQEYE